MNTRSLLCDLTTREVTSEDIMVTPALTDTVWTLAVNSLAS